MSDHSHFEELAALEAAGFLSDEECVELREHTKTCAECQKAEEEFRELVRSDLPLTVSPVREFVDRLTTRPDSDIRARFLRRARLEGIALTAGAEESPRHSGKRVGFFVATATALAAMIAVSVFYGVYLRPSSWEFMQAKHRADQLRQENSALTASLSQLNESIVEQKREIQNLHAQLGNVAKAENPRGATDQSSNSKGQFLDAQNQDKLLAEARNEVARVDELRADDEASLVVQQVRIKELSDKLRVASATLDMERQLSAAGNDVRELMVARQLHVIDVRDTDPDGNPGRVFGRVFVTDGRSLIFYAFDLNEDRVVNAKGSFQVWAVPEATKSSARSLGFLRVDAEAQGRWVLKVDNPELVKEINSVFVTAEPAAGGKQPSGQKMLYAYLGRANHP
jgi:hypothetical protein